MTDKVIEELQSASKWFAEHGKNTNTAVIGICDRAVDEINRQRAEIESLKIANEKMYDACKKQEAEIERKDKQIDELVSFQRFCETKAVKEFAERLKEDCPDKLLVIHFDAIDKLVKEMVGEQG